MYKHTQNYIYEFPFIILFPLMARKRQVPYLADNLHDSMNGVCSVTFIQVCIFFQIDKKK